MKGGYKKFKFPFTNIYLIHWKPQTITPIHPHPNIECSFMVLKGELEENIYKMHTDGYYMINKKILKVPINFEISEKLYILYIFLYFFKI